jgi:L-threonylcarbamoyladenylate synthase
VQQSFMMLTNFFNANEVNKAADLLIAGETVAFPTETVYGLGADAENSQAVLKIYEAKSRPRFNPLIVHVASLEKAQEQGHFNEMALKLAHAFFPGPLTLVVPLKNQRLSDIALAGLKTVAIRVPNHPLALKLLQAVDRPIVAPSANPSGFISPTTAHHVQDLNGRIGGILDGGACRVGVESTIVACLDKPVLLRAGGLPREAIEVITGKLETSNAMIAPGQLASHYAPRNPIRLNAVTFKPHETIIAFGAYNGLSLSQSGNLAEAASNLFHILREADKQGQPIAVMPIPHFGLGEAINDRLKRAAS